MRGQVCTSTKSKKKQNKLDEVHSKMPEFPKCSECDLEIVDTVRALNCDKVVIHRHGTVQIVLDWSFTRYSRTGT